MSDGITDSYRSGWRGDFAHEPISKKPGYHSTDDRPSWNCIWSEFAISISKRSCDAKYKVGAVIVTSDNTQVLAIGYNGDEKGGPNERVSQEKDCSGFLHAEVNALLKCDYNFPKDKKMYVTLSPCVMCAKAIINSDIKSVIYINKYDEEGISLLRKHGISVVQYIE
jgi:dCMP deaminase